MGKRQMKHIEDINEFVKFVYNAGGQLDGSLLNLATGKLELSCQVTNDMITSDGLASCAIEDAMCILASAVKVMGNGSYVPVLFIEEDGETYYCTQYTYREAFRLMEK